MVLLTDVFEYAGDLVPKDFTNDERVVKINIYDKDDKSSEGIWAYIKNPEDIIKYERGWKTDIYNVILINQPLAYSNVLRWGFVIQVIGDGKDNRPILDNNWLDNKIDTLRALLSAESTQ
jgi:hypothetical protein